VSKELEQLKSELEVQILDDHNLAEKEKENHEEMMKKTLEEILRDPGNSISSEKALRIQENMRAITEKEDGMLLYQLESGQEKETGLESYARFTEGADEAGQPVLGFKQNIDDPNPVLAGLNQKPKSPQSFQTAKREQCATCILQ